MKDIKEPIIVVGAGGVLEDLRWQNERALLDWKDECVSIKASFKQKTSRSVKNGTEYTYTKWYKIKPDGSLESVGSKEPDWKELYPPEPTPEQVPGIAYNGHLLVDKKDYEANRKLFKDYLAFELMDCMNRIHPLYKNSDKALKDDSVRRGGVSSERSSGRAGQNEDPHFVDMTGSDEEEDDDSEIED